MLTNLLVWLHFIGIGMGMGGGIALSKVGPRLIEAPPEGRALLWQLEIFFSRIGAAGLSGWFVAKMLCVLVALVGVVLHEWAGRRFRRGDAKAVPLMFIGGRMAGIGIVLAMLCAAMTFG
jgi:uncharacterized membrane protein